MTKKEIIILLVFFLIAFFNLLKLSPLYKWVYDVADKDSFASTEKIQKTLGWKAKYSNQDTLVRAFNWYLDHYDEVKQESEGITHRKAWKQGILRLIKKVM